MPRQTPRIVRLSGASNFRDLGGYPTADGRHVRWGRLYRSDHLADLTPDDHAQLAARGLAASFDFRGESERAATPYRVPGLRQVPLSIEPTVVQNMDEVRARGEELTEPMVEELMKRLYRSLVGAQADRYAEFFGHVLQAEEPVVFHCTAGKDRTGVAAALLLRALGVAHDLVMQDYLLTNELYRPPMPRDSPLRPEVLRVLWGVQPGFLEAAWGFIDERFGGLERYLQERLGVDAAARERLRERYLQQA